MKSNFFICLYGFPSAGKTTYSKKLKLELEEKGYLVEIVSSDEVRKELYGSEDHYGNSEEIFKILMDRAKWFLCEGKVVIYDACNLWRSYRIDVLNALSSINVRKILVRINNTKEICLKSHKYRGRNIPEEKLLPYFEINEPPRMEEGWEEIYDTTWNSFAPKLYLASPFFDPKERETALEIAENFRLKGYSVFVPLEHKVENAWDLPNYAWGKAVFNNDIKAIKECNAVICLSYGRISSAGTNWEAGYAYGIGKKVIVVEMEGVTLMSLMLSNSAYAVLNGKEQLENYDFRSWPRIMDYEMEQK